MSRQEETIKIVEPFRNYLEHQKGWKTEKTHGNQFQSGFPDLYCIHPKYEPRWVECKVITDGRVHFEQSQLTKFPIWSANNVKIWVIAAYDLRPEKVGWKPLEREYAKLFQESNLPYFFNKTLWKMIVNTY